VGAEAAEARSDFQSLIRVCGPCRHTASSIRSSRCDERWRSTWGRLKCPDPCRGRQSFWIVAGVCANDEDDVLAGVEIVADIHAMLVAAPVADLEAGVDCTHTVLGVGGVLVPATAIGTVG
jgi:hypothetical protein